MRSGVSPPGETDTRRARHAGFKSKALLVAAAMACAVGPAVAYSDTTAGGSFTAVDYAWQANGTSGTTVTVTPGQTVTFGYPAGTSTHNVVFTGPQPAQCTGLTPYPQAKGWTGECRFDAAGSYPFVCVVHDQMRGTVVVAAAPAPTATPTPTPTATADPGTATPGTTPVPPPGDGTPTSSTSPTGTSVPTTTSSLKVKLAVKQKGTRVRGTVTVERAASRVEVTVRSGRAKVGGWVRKAAAKGPVTFSVPLSAKARRTLKAKHRLKLTVTVVLTAPDGRRLTKRATAVVSL